MGKDHTKPQTIPFKLIINPLIVLQEKLYVLLNMGLGRRTSIILMVATLLFVSSSLTLTGAVQSEIGAGGKDKPSQKVKVTTWEEHTYLPTKGLTSRSALISGGPRSSTATSP